MAEVGNKTGKQTQAGRDVYKTPEGETVSEKSTTFKYKGKWINVPTIFRGHSYDEETLRLMLDQGLIKPTSTHDKLEEALSAAQERTDFLEFNKGGTFMINRPYNMFSKGGLKDEGGEIDPVSGNEVPVGGTKKGVRDDIPVNLSEGEFVMPEDATRYHGLKTMMKLRQEAKMGLKQMEAMGLMGNADEATLPDDLPFGMDDLIIVDVPDNGEAKNMAVGGVTTSTATGTTGGGVRIERPTTIPQRPDTSIVNPEGGRTQFRQLTTSPIPTRLTIPEFKEYMGEAYLEFKEYRNAEGKSMLIPFIGGKPLYPIPDGYTLYNSDVVGEDSIGETDTGTVDSLIEQQTAESEKESVKSRHGYETKGSEPINWSSLSDQELLNEAGKRMGFGRTLAEGIAMGINPIAGLGVKALLSVEDAKVLEELKRRADAGSTMFNDIIKTYEDKSKGILNSAIGKVVDLYSSTFGKTEEEVAKTASILKKENIPVTTKKNEQGVYDSATVQKLTEETQTAYEEAAFGTPIQAQTTIAPSSTQDNTITGFEQQDPRSQGVTTPEEVVMQQPVISPEQQAKIDTDKEQIVMDQPVVPSTEPSEFVQSRTNFQETGDPLGQGTIISSESVPDIGPSFPVSSFGQVDLSKQTEDAFEVTPLVEDVVQATTGTQYVPAEPDPTSYAVTPQQVAYSTSVSQGQEDPYDPRGIMPVSEQVTVPKPVTTPIQTTITQPTVPEVDTAPSIPTATVDTPPSISAQIPPLSPETPTAIKPSAPAVETSTPSDQTAEMFREQEQKIAEQQGAGSTMTQADKEEIVMNQPVTPVSKPVSTPTVTQVTPSQEIQDAVTAADITYDAFGDVIQKQETFDEAFARNKKLGASTFSFDKNGDGVMEVYTTQTAEEAAAEAQKTKVEPVSKGKYNPADSDLAGPATTNTLSSAEQTAFDNAVDSGDTAVVDHYVSVNRLRDKQDKYAASGFDPTVGASLGLSKTDMEQADKYGGSVQTAINEGRAESEGILKPVKVTDSSKSKDKDDSPAPSTSSSSKDNNVASSGRTETEIQNDINNALKESGGEWTNELNDLVSERDSARENEGTPKSTSTKKDKDDDGGGGGGGGGGCVIATHGISTGGFSLREKAKAEIWCERTYHGKWYGEAFRRGYRYLGKKAIEKGKAVEHYQEFKDFVSTGRGLKKDWKSKINYYKRTIQFFLVGLFVKEDV